MSWSAAGMVEGVTDIDNLKHESFGDDSAEVKEQIAAARDFAKQIIREGLVGKKKDGRKFHVAMSGHANPGHEPEMRMSNDQMIVSVRQV